MDVDGTLTDGGIYVDGGEGEYKRFDVQDGMGIVLFRRWGGRVALISGRYSAATERRSRELNVDFLVNGCAEKLPILREVAEKMGAEPGEVVYVGDDVNDLECVEWAGLGVAVANAVAEVCAAADFVTTRRGGEGAVREVADKVLALNAKEVNGLW